jgi:hypothetical protein
MAKGGKREGAGRKTGASSIKTREIADELAKSDKKTPLEVMLEAMHYSMSQVDAAESPLEKKIYYEAAHAHAKDAAPYIHPKLASAVVDHKSTDGSMSPVTDEDKEIIKRALKNLKD